MKKINILLTIVILLPSLLLAQVPKTLNFQGVLTDPIAGQPVADGDYTFDFEIFDAVTAGATTGWTEQQVLTTSDGLYNAVLGAVAPLNIAFDKPYWLEITVEGELLTTRIEITAPAYALNDNIEDLADGTLSGSKVGTGINGANINNATITTAKISGTIAIADGGTNASTVAAARSNLGLAIGTNVQAYDADLKDLADGSLTGSKVGAGINGSNVTTGTIADARLETTINRTSFAATSNVTAGNYVTALGGVHVGGTSDPGTDNLVVDGNTTLTGNVGIAGTSPSSSYPFYMSLTNKGTYNIFSISNKTASNSYAGVFSARGTSTSSSLTRAVWAESINTSGSGASYAVYASASGSSTGPKYGVYGTASGSAGTTRYGVYCNGNMAYTGTITDVSDRKFKKDIVRIDNVLEKILLLRPSTYQYKSSEYAYMGFDDERDLGLIAQEAELIFPEVVSDNHHPGPSDKDGKYLTDGIDYKGIDYTKFTPIVIRAIQEQQEIIVSQKEEINALKEALAKQLATTNQLKSENNTLQGKVEDLGSSIQKIEEMLNLKASKK